MALIDEIRRKNPSLSDRSDDEIKSLLRQSPEFQYFNDEQFDAYVTGGSTDGQGKGEDEPGFFSGLSAGIDQLQGMGGGLIMAGGDALDSDGMYDAGRDIYQSNMAEAQENALGYGFTDIRGPGDAWQWAKYTAGNQLPMLAASVASGGAGGIIAGQGAKMMAGAAAKQTAKRAGQAMGAYAGSAGMETGAIMGETEDLDVSLAHGSVAGALDAVTPVRLLRKSGAHELADKAADEISDGVLNDLKRQAGRSTLGAARSGSLTNMLGEMGTEGLQGLISQHANHWVENNGESLLTNLDEVNVKQVIDEAAAGGLMGGVAGAPAGIGERRQARSQVERIESAREQTAQQGGDALDQAMAAQQAEQEAQSEAEPVDPAVSAALGNRIQLAMGELDDLQNMMGTASYQGKSRHNNASRIIDRAEQAYQDGNIEQAERLTGRVETIAANLRRALSREGTDERPARREGEMVDGDEGQAQDGVAGLIGQDGRRLPPGDPSTIYAGGPTADQTQYDPQARNVRRDEGLAAQRQGAERMRDQQANARAQITDQDIMYGQGPVAGNANTGLDQPVQDPRFTDTGARQQAEDSRARQQRAADAAAEVARTRGQSETAYLPDNTPVATRFRVRDLAEVTPSNSADGRVNPAYPQELQPRDRTNANSQVQVRNIASRLNPERLGSSSDASSGAPIIGADGVVESGNGRTMAIEQAYRANGQQAQAYRDFVRQEAAAQGMDPTAVDAMQRPVLVRERTSNIDRADFARRANESNVAGMTAFEQAISDASMLSADDLSMWQPDQSGDPLAASNRDFQRLFISRLGNNEAARYTTRNGQASAELGERMQRAVFALAYRDSDGEPARDLIELASEQADQMRNLMAGLQAAAPDLAVAQDTGSAGAVYAVQSIIDAVRLVRQSRDSGASVRELVNQVDAFDSITPATTADLALTINQNMRSRKAMTEAFRYIGQETRRRAESANNGALFEDTTTEGDIFNAGFQQEGQPAGRPATEGAVSGRPTPGQPEPDGQGQAGAAQGAQEAQGQADPVDDAPLLDTYDEQDLTDRDQAQQQAEAAEAQRRREEQQRAQADADRDDFRLFGSNSDADIAAGYGQNDLLGAQPAQDPDPEPEPYESADDRRERQEGYALVRYANSEGRLQGKVVLELHNAGFGRLKGVKDELDAAGIPTELYGYSPGRELIFDREQLDAVMPYVPLPAQGYAVEGTRWEAQNPPRRNDIGAPRNEEDARLERKAMQEGERMTPYRDDSPEIRAAQRMDEMRALRTADTTEALEQAEQILAEQVADPELTEQQRTNAQMLARAVTSNIRSNLAKQASVTPEPMAEPAAVPERPPRPADDVVRPEGRPGWRTQKAAQGFIDERDMLGVYEPEQEDGKRWILRRQPSHDFTLTTRTRQARQAGMEYTAIETELNRPEGMDAALFDKVVKAKVPGAKLRKNKSVVSLPLDKAEAVIRHLEGRVFDGRDPGHRGDEPLTDLRDQHQVSSEAKRDADIQPATGNALADEMAGMSDSDLEAMIDDVADDTAAPETSKPKTQRKKTATTDSGKKKPRPARSRAEKYEEGNQEGLEQTSGEIAKNMGVNLSSGGKNAVEGLAKLFGGKGKLSSGLTFDEETYAQAKPHFAQMFKDFQAAGKDLRALIRAILDNFGDGVKPYIMRFAQDLRAGNVDLENEGEANVSSASQRTERDSGESAAGDELGASPVPDGSGRAEPGAGAAGGSAGSSGSARSGDSGVSEDRAGAGGAGSNQRVHRADGEFATARGPAGGRDAGRGRDGDDGRAPTDAGASTAVADHAAATRERVSDRAPSDKAPIPAALDSIKASVPSLMDMQAEDVAFAERRFFESNERGVLFANGTGTGKTFSGLGVAKRFDLMGKGNTLVVVPSDKIARDWMKAGEVVGLPITQLKNTQDNGGSGAVITTYANFRQNPTLAEREWDLVMTDEAHNLLQKDDFQETAALSMLRALSGYPGSESSLVNLRNPERAQELEQIQSQLQDTGSNRLGAAAREQLEARAKRLYREREAEIEELKPQQEAKWQNRDTRVTFLSATPFAYRKSIEYANGYLFDYQPPGTEAKEVRSYNEGDAREQFFMANFGYRMRYNKLNEPESDVDVGLMEREFNQRLKAEGAMRARMLEVDQDYDRRFQLVAGGVGTRIDEGLEWLSEQAEQAREKAGEVTDPSRDNQAADEADMWTGLKEVVNNRFNYLSRAFLLESIKAKAAVPYIEQHLAQGRKVVVFHDFNKGGGFHPFRIDREMAGDLNMMGVDAQRASAALEKARPDLVNLDLTDLKSPHERITEAFGERMAAFNGTIPKSQRRANVEAFNRDGSGVDVFLVQADAGGAGISLHDTTGDHQRALINLGLPVKPTMAIQIEGRIYRVGVQSDAIFRYMSTGLAMERSMVASKLAERAGTAENLAMGNQARALKDNIIEAYQDADNYPAGMEGEGKGGKELDRTAADMTDFDRARSFYYAQKKRDSRNKAREGADYYATPEPVGLKMAEWAGIRAGDDVLEPSAGHGAIARWVPDTARAHFVEPSYELASKLRLAAGEHKVYESSFEDLAKANKYDSIAMNPPFGQGGKLAVEHLDKAFTTHLRPGGRVVALIPTGPAADKRFNKWLENTENISIVADVKMPAATFERAGTKVMSRILVIDKPTEEGGSTAPARNIDLSGAQSANELFEQIEGIAIDRERPAPEAAPEVAAANRSQSGSSRGEPTPEVGFETAETTHAKKGIELFVAKQVGWVDRETYRALSDAAKDNGGYYSKFDRNGAIPGYQFERAEDRAAFIEQAKGLLGDRYSLRPDDLANTSQPSADDVRAALAGHEDALGDVEVIDSPSDLSDEMLTQMLTQGVDPGSVRGFYQGNRLYVIAGNNESLQRAVQTAVHEAVGHKGIRGVLGNELTLVMRRLFRGLKGHPKGREALAEVMEAYPHLDASNRDHQVEIAEEMVAHLLEKGYRPSTWQKAVAKIRELLRRLFPSVGWTYTDALALGEKSRDYLRRQQSSDSTNADIRYSLAGKRKIPVADQFDDLNDAGRSMMSKFGPKTPPKRAYEWWQEFTSRGMLKIRQGMVDQVAALKELDEKLLGERMLKEDINRSSWVLARMSNAANGALHAMLHTGRIALDPDEKIIKIKDDGSKGLGEVLGQLGSAAEIERFMMWIAANRSDKLNDEGREFLFTEEEIQAGKAFNEGKMEDGRDRKTAYDQAFKEFQQYRDDVLAVAEQAGIIKPEQREQWAEEFYVPFYRLSEEKGAPTGQMATAGLSRQQAYKRLKGGTQNINDLLQNTMMNFHHLLDASLKNQAAVQAVDNAKQMGMAEQVPESARDTKTSTFVMEGGKKVYYQIDDPLVFQALTALASPGMNSTAMKVMRGFKRVFTNMTTSTPQFMVANLIRDSLQASATSEVSKNAFANASIGARTYRDERTRAQMMASGASFNFGHLYGHNPDELRSQLTRDMRDAKIIDGPYMIPGAVRKGWAWWNDVNNSAENLNRAAIYAQNRDKGELRAAFEARDLIDFSSHGAWPAIRILIDIVPFLNARLQGLDKIYRSGVKPGTSVLAEAFGKGKASVTDKQAAARFYSVAGTLAMATVALYLHNQDDEEYQKLEDWQKDTYWYFRAGDQAFFIPKPFEVGAIATMSERITQQFVDDQATGKVFRERMMHMVFDTFSFSPVPQMMQPALDVYANYDAFTGRPIESMGMERLSPELRKRSSTTKGAEWISGVLNSTVGAIGNAETNPLALSPVQVDHLVGGYLGQVGSWVMGFSDVAWRYGTGHDAPASRWYEYQPMRRFYKNLGDEDRYTKYGSVFYEGLREAQRANADVKELRELGRLADAAEVAREKNDMLRLRLPLQRAQSRLTKLNQRMEMIRRSDVDGEVKRQRLDRVRAIKNQIQRALGERVMEVRTG